MDEQISGAVTVMEQPITQPPFVGASRMRLVDGLLSVLDEVKTHRETRLVSLEAPSGWGKTRVAQEFYARLAAREAESNPERYWPASILDTIPQARLDQVGSRRKHVYPKWVERTPNALPSFFWWGIACDMRSDGTPSEALLTDLRQLETHALYLEAAWAAAVSFKERHFPSLEQAKASLLRHRRQALEAGCDELVGFSIGKALELTLPGGGIVAQIARLTAGKAIDRRRNAAHIKAGGRLEMDQPTDIIDGSVDLITRLAHPELPFVIFVEDLHRATPLVEELLARLVRSNAAILIITSTWPGELERLTQLNALLEDATLRQRCRRIRHDQPPPPSFPADASLDALPTESLAELVEAYYPGTAAEVVDHLARRYNNPLPLELICTMPKLQRRYGGRALELSPEAIDALPDNDVHTLYRALWEELPETARQALALATLAIPDRSNAWHNGLTGQAIAAYSDLTDNTRIAEHLTTEQIPHGWVRAIEALLRRFNEPDQRRIAEEERGQFLFDPDIDAFYRHLGEQIRHQAPGETERETQHRAWLTLTLHHQGKGEITDTEALMAIRTLQQALADLPRELPTLIRLGDYLEKLQVNEDSPELLEARAEYGQALGESGKLKEALNNLQALRADRTRILGPDHPDTLRTRNNIAYWQAQSGAIEDALAAFEALLVEQTRILGPDHPDTLATHNNIASLQAESGAIEAALAAFEALLPDCTRILGPDHPQTLSMRNNIAVRQAESGAIAAALVAFEALLADKTRILGPDHPDTLTTRNNIAYWQAESGAIEAALAAFEALLPDCTRILGPDHPHTLTTRNNITYWQAESGAIEDALAAAEALLADRTRILGPDHPDTLNTRNNIARWQAESGAIEVALAADEALLADRTRILGPDHPDTLNTRNNIARWQAESGAIEVALAADEALLADRTRILGPDHPDTLTTRNNIARWQAESGAIEAALVAFEALLADQTRILGPDHPDTLTTRNNIARWQAESGAIEVALAAFEALLPDCTRILGPDHPHTLATRNNIAYLQAESGAIEAALVAFEALLADQTRILGPDHPHTLSTRNNITYWQAESGAIEAALAAFEALLADCTRILGPDHPDTLTTRNNIARWQAESGAIEAALAAAEALLADRTRILGPDHPDTLNTRNNIARWQAESGAIEVALAAAEALLADQTRILGPDHPDTLTTRNNIARWQAESGAIEVALAAAEALLADQTRILGPDHPHTLATRNNI
ncbi:tetratricopeptide repeat protein, partial [Marichromatium sp. AB32]|uniref:tetratricopeptide repeat protein n=1 Tax=Marichromatium sp. AB32 TaxID=2483363 RepID=UPI00168197AD